MRSHFSPPWRHDPEITDQFKAIVTAIGRSQAVVEFNLDGTILTANENFLATMGYTLDEIAGRHHAMFVDEATRGSQAYRDFWTGLARGEFRAAEFKRIAKNGREVWLQAAYNPVLDADGKPCKVVKFATDVTQGKLRNTDFRGQIKALHRPRAASEAGNSAEHLDAAADSMDRIIHLINKIASQINLLTLTATIESARAGKGGKGFAAVAGEVKGLAHQAQGATKEISFEINKLRDISTLFVEALAGIRQAIEMVNGYLDMTSASVDEQSRITHTLSETMQRAALAVTHVFAS